MIGRPSGLDTFKLVRPSPRRTCAHNASFREGQRTMQRRVRNLLLVFALAVGVTSELLPRSAVAAAWGGPPLRSCRDLDRAWNGSGLDLSDETVSVSVGRQFRVNEGSLTVVVRVTAVDAIQHPTDFDFAAGLRIGAVIVTGGDISAVLPFDPPAQSAVGLSGPRGQGIERIDFCYQPLLPAPPAPSGTTGETVARP